MSTSAQFPVAALTVLGILIVVLGLFAAGSIAVAALGLASVGFSGQLAVLGSRRSA